MTRPPFPILYEDNHLLVVNKPAELPTMGVAADKPSLLALAKQYIKEKYGKPGDVYLGIVSRLDAPVTGALVMARTSKAASRLTKQFRERDVTKLYWALIEASAASRFNIGIRSAPNDRTTPTAAPCCGGIWQRMGFLVVSMRK
jgi:23S rRNA-/tRNA-specific pseudouridylate synthase